MASQGPPPAAGIDLPTLVITAVASAAAAYLTAKIWAPGTLASAAMTPVLVALVKEGLRKPTQVVATMPQRVTRTGRTREGDALGTPAPPPADAQATIAGPVAVYSTRKRRLRWRLAVLTGVLGFAVCVVVYTVPELIAGGSVGRPGHETTLFSGSKKKHGSGSSGTSTTSKTTTDGSTSTSTTETQQERPTTVTQTVTTPAPATTEPSTATPQASSATPSADASSTTP